MKPLYSWITMLAVLVFTVQFSFGQAQYTLIELEVQSVGRDMKVGMNNLGQVVGEPTGSLQYAWQWDQGTLTQLGALDTGDGSAAHDINDSGYVVGSSAFLAGNTTGHAFFYANGVMFDLTSVSTGLNNVAQNTATSINANSDVTGWAISDGKPGVLWDVDPLDPLGGTTNITFSTFRKPLAINDNGDAVGATLQFEEALLRETDGTLFSLGQIPGSTWFGSWARDISNARVAVGGGSFSDFGQVRHAARWEKDADEYEILDLHNNVLLLEPDAQSSDALAINELDQIVGWYAVAGMNDQAVIWDPTHRALNLFNLVFEDQGWTGLSVAHDINEQGQILVTGHDPSGHVGLALLLPGFVAPTSFTTFRGMVINASLTDFIFSDDVHARYNPGFVLNSAEAPVWLVFDAAAASAVEFLVQSNAGTPGLTYTVEAWNWTAAAYDVIGVIDESFNTDTVSSHPIVMSDHIDGSGNVRSRVGWRKTGLTINFPWEVRIDQVGWKR